jgi:DNA-binding PadR family transcriptional regulator
METEKTKYAVLCLLNHKNYLGGELKTWHEYAMKNHFFVNPEPMYDELNKLEAAGLISPAGATAGLDIAQKLYQITDKGYQDFNLWRDDPRHIRLTVLYLNRYCPRI